MIKLLVCDLDGTLLDRKNKIDKHTLDNLKKYVAEGGKLVVATGRLDHDIVALEERLGIKGEYRISQNGSVIKKYDGSTILNETIEKDTSIAIANYLKETELRVEVSNLTNRFFPSKRPNGEVGEFVNSSIINPNFMEDVGISIEPNIFLIFGDENKFIPIKSYIEKHFSDKVIAIMTSPTSLEIFNNKVSKGNAVRLILEQEKLHSNEVVVMGDSDNDVSMFEVTDNSVVMTGAHERVLNMANFTFTSVGKCIENLCFKR